MSIDSINQAQTGMQASSLTPNISNNTEKQAIASQINANSEGQEKNVGDVFLDKKESKATEDKKIDELVNKVNEKINSDQVIHRELKFKVDEDSKRTVITVLDTATDEVIRQIPTEQLLELEKELSRDGSPKGLLMKVVA